MIRKILPFALTLLLGCTSPATETMTITEKLEQLFTTLYQNNEFNGAILVAEKDEILLKKGFGVADISTNIPFTPETPSNSASLAKQFVAMAVMQLNEQGKLSYDSQVNTILDDFPYDSITVRNLLTHTSGLAYYEELAYKADTTQVLDNTKVRELFNKFKPALLFTPGSKFEYSNTGYLYLAMVVEAVSGMDLGAYLQKFIFEPAGMKTAKVYSLKLGTFPPQGARGFYKEEGQNKPYDLIWMDGVYGDGNIYFSIDDLYQWHLALKNNTLVSAKTFNEAIMPTLLNTGKTSPYGFGWFIDEANGITWHTGTWRGFYNLMYRDLANNRVMIFLDNHRMKHRTSVAKAVLDILNGREVHFPYADSLKTPDESNNKWIGTYAFEATTDTLQVVSTNNRLAVKAGMDTLKFYQLGNSLYVPEWDATFEFEKEGEVSAVRRFQIRETTGHMVEMN